MDIKLLIERIINETISFDKIVPNQTKIKYILPGSTGRETSTGLVVGKESTRTEDYLIVLDDKTRKKTNVFMNRVADIIGEGQSKLTEKTESEEIREMAVDLIDYLGAQIPPQISPRAIGFFRELGFKDNDPMVKKVYQTALQLNSGNR